MKKQFGFLDMGKAAGLAGLVVLLLAAFVPLTVQAAAPSPTTVDECEDEAIQAGLIQNSQAHLMSQLQASQEAVTSNMKQFAKNPMRVHMDIGKTMCIDVLLNKQRRIRKLIGKDSLMEELLDRMLANLSEATCSYVQQNIETALNNALNLLCIPIPNIGFFTLDLPSLERTSCDNVSLANYMHFTAVPAQSFSSRVPDGYLGAPLTRMIDINTNAGSLGAHANGW